MALKKFDSIPYEDKIKKRPENINRKKNFISPVKRVIGSQLFSLNGWNYFRNLLSTWIAINLKNIDT